MKIIKILIPFCLFMIFILSVNAQNLNDIECKKIDAEELKELIDSGESHVIFDIRPRTNYNDGHLPNAIFLRAPDIDNEVTRIIPDKNTKIIVYSENGHKSEAICKFLVNFGYKNVYNFGEIKNWPYELVKTTCE